MEPASTPRTKRVFLRKNMKFNTIVGRHRGEGKGKGKVKRQRFVGPCEVEMTDEQIKSFKDLLETAPQEVVVAEPEPEPQPAV